MTYQPLQFVSSGGQNRTVVFDADARDLLVMILMEMRIMNLHLAEMSDQQFDVSDAEVRQ